MNFLLRNLDNHSLKSLNSKACKLLKLQIFEPYLLTNSMNMHMEKVDDKSKSLSIMDIISLFLATDHSEQVLYFKVNKPKS